MASKTYSINDISEENKEKALLIGVKFQEDSLDKVNESMLELQDLTRTAGAEVVDTVIQSKSRVDPKYFIGRGKLEEIDLTYNPQEYTLIIINHEISPAQARNIESALHKRVVTRTELILDIFAIHARSKTSKLQVELAQEQYQLPRIMGKGASMSRIEGGIGMRGPGEQQLELDRRFIRNRIHLIRKKLKNIEKSKATQRKGRYGEFKVAIVGYTNSGKSTLLNSLVKAGVLTEDKLFATLDTTTRKLWLGDNIKVLMTDTVGFIRDIPHSLIESFRSTLEDTLNADLLLHIVDINSAFYKEKIEVVEDTISEMGGDKIPILLCFNKIDSALPERILSIRREYPEALYISATEKTYIDSLKGAIKQYALEMKNKIKPKNGESQGE